MGGIDFMIFGAMLWLIDARKIVAPFRPAIVMGMNAIAIYLASEFLIVLLEITHYKEAIYQTLFAPLASPVNASLLFAIAYVLLHYLLALALYRRNLFLKI